MANASAPEGEAEGDERRVKERSRRGEMKSSETRIETKRETDKYGMTGPKEDEEGE